ncbi:MAG: cell surface protein SprA, partial [Bacteroidales bacterium]|nr:cell surface protein SprA [Bacteroidales bacterium]
DQRQKEDIQQADVSGNLELGKFFPEKWAVSIPMYAGYSIGVVNPQYDPLDPDIPIDVALDNAENKTERNKIKEYSQDFTERKNINFTNIRINRTGNKPRFYSISNFSTSFGISEMYYRDFATAFRYEKNERYAINYNYNARPKNIAPFSKSKILKKPVLKLIGDFNFYLYPSNISFRTDIERDYFAERLKNINSIEDYTSIDVVDKIENLAVPNSKPDMNWNRFVDIKYDLTRAIKLDFSSTNRSRINTDETLRIENEEYSDVKNSYEPHYHDWKNDTRDSLFALNTRNLNYNHTFNATYTLPINKLPLLDWTSSSLRYNATYGWTAGPRNLEDSSGNRINLGNTIKNSNTVQLNTQFNLLNLYNKIPYLKDINQKFKQKSSGRKPPKKYKTVTYTQENVRLRADRPKNIFHKLKTEDVTVKVTDQNGKQINGEMEIIDENKIKYITEEDFDNVSVVVEGKVEDKESILRIISDHTFRLAMTARNFSVSFSETNGSLLPGYMNDIQFAGIDFNNNSPEWWYVFGWVPEKNTIENWVTTKSWFTTSTYFNESYSLTKNNNFNARGSLEPFEDFRIDLTATRNMTSNKSAQIVPSGFPDEYDFIGYRETGNFSMSFWSFKTAFMTPSDSTDDLKIFDDFKNKYRGVIQNRLYTDSILNNPYIDTVISDNGYGLYTQQVMIPAFLAAYTGIDVNEIFLDPMPGLKAAIPLPNWRINYDGLSKIPFLKKYFRSINLSHSYRSTYNVSSYTSNLRYKAGRFRTDSLGNFIPQYDIATVSITEQFSPLINIDLTWKNNLITRFEFKKDRNISLSLANNQVTEAYGKEFVFGSGFRFKEVQIIINNNEFKSDLNIRADFSIRDNITIVRRLLEGIEADRGLRQSGMKIMSIKLSADYVLSDRFNLRLFFDRVVNKPHTSISSNTYNTNIGFSLNFSLIQ